MVNIIPVVVTVLAVFSHACSASECLLSNVEILNDLIDERINATIAAKLEELIATEEFNVAVEGKVVAMINNSINALYATVDEVKTTVNTTLRTVSKLSNQPSKNSLCYS